MKLIAISGIVTAAGIVRPGNPFETQRDDEGENLVARQFARHPSDQELASHWPAQKPAAPAPSPEPAPAQDAEDDKPEAGKPAGKKR